MSSILLSNPFIIAPPPLLAAGADAKNTLAVSPSQRGTNAGESGNGPGFGNRESGQTIITWANRAATLPRPAEATWDSIVNAQTSEGGADPFGIDLPKVKMPDPLPTSPFLKPG